MHCLSVVEVKVLCTPHFGLVIGSHSVSQYLCNLLARHDLDRTTDPRPQTLVPRHQTLDPLPCLCNLLAGNDLDEYRLTRLRAWKLKRAKIFMSSSSKEIILLGVAALSKSLNSFRRMFCAYFGHQGSRTCVCTEVVVLMHGLPGLIGC